MKDIPTEITGARGPWYKRVKEIVSQVSSGDSRIRVIEILGVPDEVRAGSPSAVESLQATMEELAGGPTLIQYGDTEGFAEVLVYRDPARPRRLYLFGIRDELVAQKWIEQVEAAEDADGHAAAPGQG